MIRPLFLSLLVSVVVCKHGKDNTYCTEPTPPPGREYIVPLPTHGSCKPLFYAWFKILNQQVLICQSVWLLKLCYHWQKLTIERLLLGMYSIHMTLIRMITGWVLLNNPFWDCCSQSLLLDVLETSVSLLYYFWTTRHTRGPMGHSTIVIRGSKLLLCFHLQRHLVFEIASLLWHHLDITTAEKDNNTLDALS